MAEKVFGNIIPIMTEAEFENKESDIHTQRKNGNTVAKLQVMHHIATHMKDESGMTVLGFEAIMLGDKEAISKHLDYDIAMQAMEEIMSAAKASLAKAEEEKTAAFRAAPQLTEDGKEPNAVLVKAEGGATLVHLDGFVAGDDLGKPLDCSSIDMVLKNLPAWSKQKFGVKLAGYVNRNGIPEGLDENDRIQSLSGYDYIAGDCVLVRIDDKYNYLPLNPQDAVEIWKYFQ